MKLKEIKVFDKKHCRIEVRDAGLGFGIAYSWAEAEKYMDCTVVSYDRDRVLRVKLDHDDVVMARIAHGLDTESDGWKRQPKKKAP